jgi:Tol biopolymer transport system component
MGISELSASGGETSLISVPFSVDRVDAVSPDRSNLLVTAATANPQDHGLWTLPLPAGSPRRLGDMPGKEGDWSPDGKSLAFVRNSDIYVANADGSQPRKLLTAPGAPVVLHFSPDSQRLRYTVFDATHNTYAIWEVRADGSNPHPLLPRWHNPPAECCGVWTPDGRYYVFQVFGEQSDLWAIRESGNPLRGASSQPMRLTTGPLSYFFPTPSLDGRKIFAVGKLQQGELVRYDLKAQEFVNINTGVSAGEVSFSRDAQWAAWVHYPDGTMWRSHLDGSERVQLTFPPQMATLPRWSPDGRTIAYVAAEIGKPWKIFLVPSQGGAAKEVLPETRNEMDVDWSADGSKLVFGRLSEQVSSEPINIQLIDLASGRVSVLPGSENLFSPRWSPDGRYIAALAADYKALLLFDLQTQKWIHWVDEPNGVISFPSWASDSKSIYYTQQNDLRKVGLGAHDSQEIASLRNLKLFRGRWGSWGGMSPDGSPLFVRDISTQEIYALDVKLP